jgi:hypothetical protein
MFGSILSDFKSYVDPRYLISIFLPCLAFSTIFIALVAYSLNLEEIYDAWNALPIDIQAFIVVFYLSFIYLLSFILSASLGKIIRIYEGYWDERLPLVGKWKDKRKLFYQNKLTNMGKGIHNINDLTALEIKDHKTEKNISNHKGNLLKYERDESEIFQVRYTDYPPFTRCESVMPTKFGNVIKSWELYPQLHYNMSTALLWPRLYPLLKETDPITRLLIDARVKMESMVAISVLGAVFALAGFLYFVLIKPFFIFFLLTFCGGLIIWWLAYYMSIESARVYGELVKSTFDVYRRILADALKLPPCLSLDEERKQWQMVNAFFYRNKNYGLTYTIAQEKNDEKSGE